MQRRGFLKAAAGAAGAAALPLSACGDGSGGGDVTLKLVAAEYGTDESDTARRYWEQLAAKFSNDTPGISVDIEIIPWEDIDAKVDKMVKDGNPPDVAQMGPYAEYSSRDMLYSTDELLSIPTQANFVPSLAAAGEVNRVQYGMPFVSSSRLLFYNKSLFEDAGLSTDPEDAPKDWDELLDVAQALKDTGVKVPYALPLGPEEAQGETLMWMISGGGAYMDDVGSYTIDSEQNIHTFNWIRDNLVGAGLTYAAPSETNRRTAFADFVKGDVGMIFGHPTLMQNLRREKVDFGIALKLPGRDGPSESTMGVADWIMAFKANGHRSQIGKFLDVLFDDTNVLKFAQRYDLLPTTVSGVDKLSQGRKDLQPFLDQLQSAVFYPDNKTSWARVNAELKKQIGKAAEAGGEPPERVLTNLQSIAESASTTEE
ncbi:ABC transporter substrate-binding protein [Streptomyces sp. CMB-StM0423]|uniref:ABC transporter substrate-binding protein n=1 Tax=Streptomyces sp. CMB-StM0423 TaxID=2059884 RepID=UPI000C70A4AF|nr:extracellular solute-binding protein [Streptomyces sp. CMB-StM0423]AUH41402.1 ABC transporter substrate-binding protein [Streptomyces sp. CMB-StM0423]